MRFSIKATNCNDPYSVGLKNGLWLAISYLTGEKPQFEICEEPEVMKWIPVSEMMPFFPYESILLTYHERYTDVDRTVEGYIDERDVFHGADGEEIRGEVTAWQTMPTPYRGK